MSTLKSESITFAIRSIAAHGDTDVFPLPIETHLFHDLPDESAALLESFDKNVTQALNSYPVDSISSLSAVGYTGFRRATQLDPFWNAYLLALVKEAAPQIEAARLPTSDLTVFSYRYIDDPSGIDLFDRSIGWPEFQERSAELASQARFVVATDISDFYAHVYQHRIEGALSLAGVAKPTIKKLGQVLSKSSETVSYGLPVGGPAARLLSEAVLNRSDRLLKGAKVRFCRFSDDYHIFTDSTEDAYRALILLSEKLLEHDGLTLQKSKTRIMSSQEFLRSSVFFQEEQSPDRDSKAMAFLRLRIRYDPYDPNAAEKYDELREQLSSFDIEGMLVSELSKTRVHSALTRRLISAVKFLDPEIQSRLCILLAHNLGVLAPVFPSVCQMIRAVFENLDEFARAEISESFVAAIINDHHVVSLELNLAYCLRVLVLTRTEENLNLFRTLFKTSGILVRKDLILALTAFGQYDWISDLRYRFRQLSTWERRMFIFASHYLGEEGEHWIKHTRAQFSPAETLFNKWISDRLESGNRTVPV